MKHVSWHALVIDFIKTHYINQYQYCLKCKDSTLTQKLGGLSNNPRVTLDNWCYSTLGLIRPGYQIILTTLVRGTFRCSSCR